MALPRPADSGRAQQGFRKRAHARRGIDACDARYVLPRHPLAGLIPLEAEMQMD